jgi:hypothetical protein
LVVALVILVLLVDVAVAVEQQAQGLAQQAKDMRVALGQEQGQYMVVAVAELVQ